jgi:hypothetical protein
MESMNSEGRIAVVRAEIARACRDAGRDPATVTLVAISKTFAADAIEPVIAAGQRVFGENRVQEAKAKIGLCPSRLRWHLIGHLQSNKCRDAVHFFEMIHSVDSLILAGEINKWADKSAKTMPILIEVNIAGESSKFGYAPEKLLAELKEINALPKIEVHGLMTVAPFAQDPEKVRPVFRGLRELKSECESILGAPLRHLSMGMSGDFEVAVELGATIIRLGSAILGPRTAFQAKPADV